MKKIILDGKEVEQLVPESLPMLIHGEEGSGASLYTVCLAAKWFSQGYKVLFLCGYPLAEEAFGNEIGSEHANATFHMQDKVDEFLAAVKDDVHDNTIVIVKNIELFDSNIFNSVEDIQGIIISGDLSKVAFKENLLKKRFTTEVYFSPLEGKELPQLEKYQGFVVSDNYKGITNLQ